MTIGELQDIIGDAVADYGDRALEFNVRLAQQPRWAFEYSIEDGRVVDPSVDGRESPDDDVADTDEAPTLYLVEGRQIGYLPERAASAIGWSRR